MGYVLRWNSVVVGRGRWIAGDPQAWGGAGKAVNHTLLPTFLTTQGRVWVNAGAPNLSPLSVRRARQSRAARPSHEAPVFVPYFLLWITRPSAPGLVCWFYLCAWVTFSDGYCLDHLGASDCIDPPASAVLDRSPLKLKAEPGRNCGDPPCPPPRGIKLLRIIPLTSISATYLASWWMPDKRWASIQINYKGQSSGKKHQSRLLAFLITFLILRNMKILYESYYHNGFLELKYFIHNKYEVVPFKFDVIMPHQSQCSQAGDRQLNILPGPDGCCSFTALAPSRPNWLQLSAWGSEPWPPGGSILVLPLSGPMTSIQSAEPSSETHLGLQLSVCFLSWW